jgi:hypothetical protein
MTHIARVRRAYVAGAALARAGRHERRLRIAARLRLHQRAQSLKEARFVAGARVQSPLRDARSGGMENDVLPVCDMNE